MSESEEIVLVDEDGLEHRFTLYDLIEIEQGVYALLQPIGSDDELVILRVEGSIEDGNLITLDDDEWDAVSEHIDGMELL